MTHKVFMKHATDPSARVSTAISGPDEQGRIVVPADQVEMTAVHGFVLVEGDPDATPELPPRNEAGLRLDGPTLEEFTAAGYKAEVYPPTDYAEKDSPALQAYKAQPAPDPERTVPPVENVSEATDSQTAGASQATATDAAAASSEPA